MLAAASDNEEAAGCWVEVKDQSTDESRGRPVAAAGRLSELPSPSAAAFALLLLHGAAPILKDDKQIHSKRNWNDNSSTLSCPTNPLAPIEQQ